MRLCHINTHTHTEPKLHALPTPNLNASKTRKSAVASHVRPRAWDCVWLLSVSRLRKPASQPAKPQPKSTALTPQLLCDDIREKKGENTLTSTSLLRNQGGRVSG